MAAHTLTSLSGPQTQVVQSIYNAWSASPYSGDTSVLYKTIGIATGEGLDRANPLASNADSRGTTAFGPFQLNNSGLGTDFANQAGGAFGTQSLDQQSNFVVNYVGAHGTSPWMSVGDTPGGISSVEVAGKNTLANSGINTTTGPSDSPAVQAGQFDSNSSLAPDTTPQNDGTGTGILGSGQGPGMFSDPSGSTDTTKVTPLSGVDTDASSAGTATAPSGTASTTASGKPVDVTNAKDEGLTGDNAIAQAGQGLTKGLAADTGSIAATGTGWLSSIFSGVTDAFVRSGFVFLGIVVLMGAFLFFYIDSQRGKGAAA